MEKAFGENFRRAFCLKKQEMVSHQPVLLKETLDLLHVENGKKYIDATLGLAGHTIEILKQGGQILGIDLDQDSINHAKARIKEELSEDLGQKFISACGNFKNIDSLAYANGFSQVSGILFDLGYSSHELEEGGLGLSFLRDEPLDMRMDKSLGVTAGDLINSLPEDQLAQMLREYSDERMSSRFARAIVKHRNLKKIQTTLELANILKSEAPLNYERGRIHPATRTFQALRIAVNDELENLRIALPRAAQLLLPGGVLIVISFHSLEDKVAKELGHHAQPMLTPLEKKPIVPCEEEIKGNFRSRSAKLRAYRKNA